MSTLLQQAVAAHQSGDLAGAERLYREVLRHAPDQADALALLGVVISTGGDHGQAIGLIEKAITLDPKTALFQLHLGNALMAAGKTAEASLAFENAIRLQPNLAIAHYNLANVLRKKADWAGAIASYRQAIALNPSHAEAYNNLALCLVHEKQMKEALRQAQKSVDIAPSYGEGWLTLCNVAEQTGDYELALKAGEHNTRLQPNNNRAWFGYGVALNRLERHEEAIEAYKRALILKPDRADIWDNLGQTYQSLMRLEEAEAIFRKTIEVAGQIIADEDRREVEENEYGNRHWHLALLELLRGKYKQGFARYRARFNDVKALTRRVSQKPLWKGENLAGKTILVCDEQGFGDTLMLARYLPLLKAQGASVKTLVHPALAPLFRTWPVIEDVIEHDHPASAFDYHASFFDLPHRLDTSLATIPAQIPYLPLLEPDEKTKLSSDGRPRIGIAWGGSPLHKGDLKRSIPLALFAGILTDKRAQFFSLNRDMKQGDQELLPKLPVIDLAPRLGNFADAARFMRQLDLIITCDTATAHLAGGLGKPVWVLIPFSPDWRWLSEREDSPWYPTLRLFRQSQGGKWDDVIAKVKSALSEWLSASSAI